MIRDGCPILHVDFASFCVGDWERRMGQAGIDVNWGKRRGKRKIKKIGDYKLKYERRRNLEGKSV